MRTINAKVEYEIPTIRHMTIECPDCHEWFVANDIANDHISDHFDATRAKYVCPLCGAEFGYLKDQYPFTEQDEIVFSECDSSVIYDGVKQRVERWE